MRKMGKKHGFLAGLSPLASWSLFLVCLLREMKLALHVHLF